LRYNAKNVILVSSVDDQDVIENVKNTSTGKFKVNGNLLMRDKEANSYNEGCFKDANAKYYSLSHVY